MKQYEVEFDEDGVPWASPQIQADYEAALGRFIVAFNRLDNGLARLIETVLTESGTAELAELFKSFGQRVDAADRLKSASHGGGLRDLPFAQLRDLAKHRNAVAHGHFDQNPFSGEFDIVGKDRRKYSADDLGALTAKAEEAWHQLRLAEAAYAFSAVTADKSE